MKLFISHSGDRSRDLAKKVHWLIQMVLPAVDPWISTGIDKGARWEAELSSQLEATNVGIVCLTPENIGKPWILFEAGALAKRLDGRVCTLLLGLAPEQVEPPLSQFQHTQLEEARVLELLLTINKRVHEVGEKSRPEGIVGEAFARCWQDFADVARELERQPVVAPPKRSDEDYLKELVILARSGAQQAWMQEKTLKMLHMIYRALMGEPAPEMKQLRDLISQGAMPYLSPRLPAHLMPAGMGVFPPTMSQASSMPEPDETGNPPNSEP